MSVRKIFIGLFVPLLGLLASCGGGGGGDSSGVSIQVNGQPAVTETVMAGLTVQDLAITGVVTGNVSELSGKIVYVQVVDPDQMFQNTPRFSTGSNASFRLNLFGTPLNTVGHLKGNLTIYACLDSGCKSQLGNSPITVPYDVTVSPGLVADAASVNFSTKFGDFSQSKIVNVQMPMNMTGVTISALNVIGYNSTEFSVDRPAGIINSGDTVPLTVTAFPQAPGSYSGSIKITAQTRSTGTVTVVKTTEQIIPITHVVADDPAIDAAFPVSEMSLVTTQGDYLFHDIPVAPVYRQNAIVTFVRTEYFGYPVAATGHPRVNDWISIYPMGFVPCYSTINTNDCLPVGRYTGRVVYKVEYAGRVTDLYLPATMTIN
ncbi:MAG: hypothetical protein RJA44_104 [Pseudomonadota bacterium]